MVKKMHEKGSKAKLFNISVVNFKEMLKNTNEKNARGISISQVMPHPYSTLVPVAQEFPNSMKKYQSKRCCYAQVWNPSLQPKFWSVQFAVQTLI